MNRLPKSLIDHFRAYLDRKEIYQSTRVCKDWKDISNVPTKLVISSRRDNLPPPTANISNVSSLSMFCLSVSADTTLDLLRRCAAGLREFKCAFVTISPPLSNIPELTYLRRLEITHIQSLPSARQILRSVPNISELKFIDANTGVCNLDFSLTPRLKKLECIEGNMSFENATSVSLEKIVCSDDTLDHFRAIISGQNVQVEVQMTIEESQLDQKLALIQSDIALNYDVEFKYWYEGDEALICISFNQDEAIFHGIYSLSENNMPQETDVQKMKMLVTKLQSLRYIIRISKSLHRREKNMIGAILTLTGIFSLTEIGAMCSTCQDEI